MPVLTHHAQVMYLARCMTCNWTHEFLHEEEAREAAGEHTDAHTIRHDCRYDERMGWIGRDTCKACVVEDERSERREKRRTA